MLEGASLPGLLLQSPFRHSQALRGGLGLANGRAAWLARAFCEILKKDAATVRKELSGIQDAEKRNRALEAFADMCSILGLED